MLIFFFWRYPLAENLQYCHGKDTQRISEKLSLAQLLFCSESPCTSFSLIFTFLGLTCWPICVYAVEKVVRLSLLRLLFITGVKPSSLGKSSEIWGITLLHPTDRAYFSCFFCLGQVLHLCLWSHHQVVFQHPAASWEPSPAAVSSQPRCLLLSAPHPRTDPALQHFSNSAREGQDEVSDLFASEMAGLLLLVEGTWDKRCYWCFKVFLS